MLYLHEKHLLEKLTPVVDSVFLLNCKCFDKRSRAIEPLTSEESINIYFELRETMNRLLTTQNFANKLTPLTKHTHDPCVAQRRNFFVVDPDGYLYKCYLDAGDKNKTIGHVDKPLTYNNKVMLKYLSFRPWYLDKCQKCSVFPLCFGHCIVKQWDGFSRGLIYCSGYKDIIQRELFSEIKDFALKRRIFFPHHEYKQNLFIEASI